MMRVALRHSLASWSRGHVYAGGRPRLLQCEVGRGREEKREGGWIAFFKTASFLLLSFYPNSSGQPPPRNFDSGTGASSGVLRRGGGPQPPATVELGGSSLQARRASRHAPRQHRTTTARGGRHAARQPVPT